MEVVKMGNIVIILILVVVVALAAKGGLKHLKGEGGCCGGGGDKITADQKVLEHPVIGRKIIDVEGMHCENCKNSIERRINKIEGASCHVDLKKKQAVVEYDRELNDNELTSAIALLDFKVTGIRTEEV
jgi:copper chaperone CopZ